MTKVNQDDGPDLHEIFGIANGDEEPSRGSGRKEKAPKKGEEPEHSVLAVELTEPEVGGEEHVIELDRSEVADDPSLADELPVTLELPPD